MFGDIENFAVRVADYFYETGDLIRSNEYYRLSIEARRIIKKGEIINEVPATKATFHVADDRVGA
ncbi:hypothetical protein MOD11_17640 [Bacillus atrophaeus]|uniref:hypothetical protein n=1 Tax=Bacillus atrophaeus TaxID=1452 RepID=UPI00227E733E|nr:hypothetical protein [Bacillus atrophaeus]MCY8523116.1 hypothetical protein [Bacillus atrophaeus]